MRDLPVEFHHGDGYYDTTIRTATGDVTMRLRMTRVMAANGVSLPFVEKYPICSLDDFEPVAQLFEHLEVVPRAQAYAAFHERVGGRGGGSRGVAVANGPLGASPMHLLLHDLMVMENFFGMYKDEPQAMTKLAARMQPFYDSLLAASLASDAEVIFWGANYDHDTTWPPFFEQRIMPGLEHVRDRAHAADKLLLTHTDGESRGLLPLFRKCRFDVGESVCLKPMTSCTLREFREGFGPDMTVFGAIPCVVLIDSCTSQRDYRSAHGPAVRRARKRPPPDSGRVRQCAARRQPGSPRSDQGLDRRIRIRRRRRRAVGRSGWSQGPNPNRQPTH